MHALCFCFGKMTNNGENTSDTFAMKKNFAIILFLPHVSLIINCFLHAIILGTRFRQKACVEPGGETATTRRNAMRKALSGANFGSF